MAYADMRIGCGGITWHTMGRKTGEPFEHQQVLADIAEAGYEGTMTGPRKDKTTAEVLAELAEYELAPAPGYLGAEFWNPAKEEEIVAQAEAHAAFAQEAGLTELYVSANGFDNYTTSRGLTRNQIAGNVQPEDMMSDAEYEQFVHTLNRIGRILLDKGVRACYHNHVGSTIETRAEIDRLFEMIDRELVFMGPDTGHLLWAGIDVLDFCRDYGELIKTIHVKDVNADVMKKGVAAGWDYATFSEHGIWTEMGDGCIDFPALFALLTEAGLGDGWVVVETDVTQLETPRASAMRSRQYLKNLGL